ncbi:MAG: TrkA family potassium uptake protein [Clostridia bacterium]|nr:TrkA family potassium uptake protein [Clostridia bacterium]
MRKKTNAKQSVMIVGCGQLGSMLAENLCEGENSVTVIDSNDSAFKKLSPNFGGFTICADAMDPESLRDADIENMDIVLVTTDNDNVNIFVAQLAKEIFNVPQVIARLYDIKREGVYKEFGIKTICPTVLSAEAFRNEVL